MKKILVILMFLSFGGRMVAQCPTEVEDISFTDCYGNEYDLLDILDGNQYILMHFTYNNTGTGMYTLSSWYHNYGCNGQDVFMMEIMPNTVDSICVSFAQNMEWPVIGGDGGGYTFFQQYRDCCYPCNVMLIRPNHEIVQDSLILTYGLGLMGEVFEQEGISLSSCVWGNHAAPTNVNASMEDGSFILRWDAVEDADHYHVYWNNNSFMSEFNCVENTVGTQYSGSAYYPYCNNDYYVVSCFADGAEYASDTVSFGHQAPDFTASDCHGHEIHLYDILDRGQYVFLDFFHYSCGPCRDQMPYIVESYYYFGCNYEDVYYIEVSHVDNDEKCLQWCDEFGVEYPTVGRDGGGVVVKGKFHAPFDPFLMLIAPDRSIVLNSWATFSGIENLQMIIDAYEPYEIEHHQCYAGVAADDRTTVGVFPNPADGFVNLSVDESGVVRVYNALGQMVDSFVAESGMVRLVTEKYPNGLYFVQVNGCSVGRFVVNHR